MKASILLKSLLHLAFPLAERLLPEGGYRRLVGGFFTLPLRLVPVLLLCAVYLGLILLGQYAIEMLLYEFVVLLKLPKVFRVEWLEPAFFALVGRYFREGALLLLGIYAAYRVLGTAGSGAYLTRREIVIVKRWPFSASVLRIPLSSVRYVVFHQFPGERLLGTGRIEIAWSDRESLVLPAVPRGERKTGEIMQRLHEQSTGPAPAPRSAGGHDPEDSGTPHRRSKRRRRRGRRRAPQEPASS